MLGKPASQINIELSLAELLDLDLKITFHLFFQVFGGSVHQKVSKDLETAVNLGWTAAKNETR